MKKSIFIILICLSTLTFSKGIHDKQFAFGIDISGYDISIIIGKESANLLIGGNWGAHLKLGSLPLYAYFELSYYISYIGFYNQYGHDRRTSYNIITHTSNPFAGRIGGGIDYMKTYGNRFLTFYTGAGLSASGLVNIPTISSSTNQNNNQFTESSNTNLNTSVNSGFDVGLRLPMYLGIHIIRDVEFYMSIINRFALAFVKTPQNSNIKLLFNYSFQNSFGFRFWF